MRRVGAGAVIGWLAVAGLVAWADDGRFAPRDYRMMFGIARGGGEARISPDRGFQFSSKHPSDLAFAQTSAPLPIAYRIKLAITNIDTRNAGCRFGIFDGAVRYGGDNDAINGESKYVLVFQEMKGVRTIYLMYFDGSGILHCWDGRRWREKAWCPTGAQWAPGRRYAVVIEKGLAAFACRVEEDGKKILQAAPVEATKIRGAGEPDYLAFGDMIADFVEGELVMAPMEIEEIGMEPYLEQDMKHVVIRKAPEGRYAMYGGLTKLPDGDIFCVYKVGSLDKKTGSPWTVRDETIVWSRSTNRGMTWPGTENLIYKDGKTRQECCCGKGYLAKNGTFMHPFYILNSDYEEEAKENNWSKVHLAVSPDQGKTWQIQRLDVPLSIAASFGGIVRLRDGTLLLNVYGAAERGSFRHQAALLRSKDDGETWSDYAIIGKDGDPDDKGPAKLNETDVVELPNGRLLSMSRTQYHNYPLYRGFSGDKGRMWAVGPSGLTGLCPSLCCTTAGPPEGTVALVYHDRWGKHATKGGVHVAFSYDGGATWGESSWISDGAYPCAIEMQPGVVFCSYYQSSVLLRGTIFRVPFPSGLRACGGAQRTKLEWDVYSGAKAKEYAYRVYRCENADVEIASRNLLGASKEPGRYNDGHGEAGRVYFYRVAAYEGERQVGVSWVVAARAGTHAEDR